MITHVRLGWGGSEKRVLWGIQALRDSYDITLVTAGEFNLKALNRYYGTDLKQEDFEVRQVTLPLFMRGNARAAALRGALYQRYCRNIADDYDILISGYGPTDFGSPAIHFIADFSWDKELREAFHPYPPGVIYNNRLARTIYLGLAKAVDKPSGRNMFSGEDLLLSVSPWIASVIKSKYGVEAPVLPSPVPGAFPVIPWEKKEWGFVCLGRMAPEKRIEDIIDILNRVREKGHAIHLHIVGDGENSTYGKSLRPMFKKHKAWITVEGRKQGHEKASILAQHTFGIHACRGDAFPGVLIEMMKAGCVVWAHDSGGQPDILENSSLLFTNNNDAADKIDGMLSDKDLLITTQRKLLALSQQYSVESYMNNIVRIVKEWECA